MFMDNRWDTTWRRDQPAQPQILSLPWHSTWPDTPCPGTGGQRPTVLPDEPHRHPYGAAHVSRPVSSHAADGLVLWWWERQQAAHTVGYAHALAESVLSRLRASGCPILLYAQVYSPWPAVHPGAGASQAIPHGGQVGCEAAQQVAQWLSRLCGGFTGCVPARSAAWRLNWRHWQLGTQQW